MPPDFSQQPESLALCFSSDPQQIPLVSSLKSTLECIQSPSSGLPSAWLPADRPPYLPLSAPPPVGVACEDATPHGRLLEPRWPTACGGIVMPDTPPRGPCLGGSIQPHEEVCSSAVSCACLHVCTCVCHCLWVCARVCGRLTSRANSPTRFRGLCVTFRCG